MTTSPDSTAPNWPSHSHRRFLLARELQEDGRFPGTQEISRADIPDIDLEAAAMLCRQLNANQCHTFNLTAGWVAVPCKSAWHPRALPPHFPPPVAGPRTPNSTCYVTR